MPVNDFLPFATAGGANVLNQSSWASLPALSTGFTSGPAVSLQFNKAFRQGIFGTAALAQLIVNELSIDVFDDGDLTGFVTHLTAAIAAASGSGIRFIAPPDRYSASPLTSLTYTLTHPPLAQGNPPVGGLIIVTLDGRTQVGGIAISGTTLTLSGITISLYDELQVYYNY